MNDTGLKRSIKQSESPSSSQATPTTSVTGNARPNPKSQSASVDPPVSGDQMAIKRILRSEGFYLNAEIEGVNTIDTGASRTVISNRVYNSIPEAHRPKLQKCVVLTDVSGQPLSQQGSACFTIQIASGAKLNSEITVADIEDDGLFGHDLLSQNDVDVLYSQGHSLHGYYHTLQTD